MGAAEEGGVGGTLREVLKAAPDGAPDATPADFFDTQAAAWDDKPDHKAMAERAVQALLARVPSLSRDATSALEFGCGTGLCSAALRGHVASILGVDTSAGMVAAFNRKAAALETEGSGTSMRGVQMFLEKPSEQLQGLMPPKGFNLVFSHLTLHHVQDIEGIVRTLVECLDPSDGVLAISDFQHSDHSTEFHPSHIHGEVKHHGICPKRLRKAMEAAGLLDVDVATSFSFEKPVDDGARKKAFDFLLGVGYLRK